ncbi:hypothetical protein C0991_005052 [Blastosporella zonata]|nr:hypothetical protein C0991_005052 [Blastosporella zonata]
MSDDIVLYDIPSNVPGSAWSPNVWKTRYTLNYKGLAYRTEWIEYPDIESTCKRIGAAPDPIHTRDGRPLYVLPVIYDPKTSTAVSDSAQIAEYLDATYPDTPRVLPPGSKTVQYAFLAAYRLILPHIFQFTLRRTEEFLNPPSQAHFQKHKYAGISYDPPTGDAQEAGWKKVEADFGLLAGWLDKGEADGPYILGANISFLDFAVAGYLIWMRIVWGENSQEWQNIKTWHSGKWDAFLKRLEKYETIVI